MDSVMMVESERVMTEMRTMTVKEVMKARGGRRVWKM
jgi:hypothetical protein